MRNRFFEEIECIKGRKKNDFRNQNKKDELSKKRNKKNTSIFILD